MALKLHNIHFCLIRKSKGVSFNKVVGELGKKFKIVAKYVTEENVKCYFEYTYQPKKNESHLTNSVSYDLETHNNSDQARPYAICFYRLTKLAGKCDRDLTPYEIDNCKKDTTAFDGGKCVENALDFCLKLKGEGRKDNKNKFLEYNLQLRAHNGNGFGTRIVLNNLSCDKRNFNIIKNGKGIIEFKNFNGYIEHIRKQIPQYLHF